MTTATFREPTGNMFRKCRVETFATWGTERIRVRSVETETSYYVPDANGTFVLLNRKDARREPRAVRVVTITTRAARETSAGLLYRIDMSATARDRETLSAFREQQTFVNAAEVWHVSAPCFDTVNYI